LAAILNKEPILEILDNGSGMDRRHLEEVWSVVATPYRTTTQLARKGSKTRRVAGEKGLGRLSMARLGDTLEMLTKAKNSACLRVAVKWSSLAGAKDLSDCQVEIDEYDRAAPFSKTGTRIRIFGLFNEWSDDRVNELREYLARLLSPFSKVEDFEIWVNTDEADATPVKVESPEFLRHPKYRITGTVDADGTVTCTYLFKPITSSRVERRKNMTLTWSNVIEETNSARVKKIDRPQCGPFTFEIRAWDIGVEDTEEIASQYHITKKQLVRAAIKAHKGISVYRDGILVLPKSEATRDWLGLDLRRISEVGTRLSTSQILGFISVSAHDNAAIKDTSDRERLVDSIEVAAFEEIIKSVVSALERERAADRLDKKTAEPALKDLFGGLSADSLVERVSMVAKEEGFAKEILPIVNSFNRELTETRKEIERRFVYYSRLATIGTLAQMLVHEVRNKTTIVGSLLQAVAAPEVLAGLAPAIEQKHRRASDAVSALDRLAETFAPLASRSFGRGRRTSILEDRIAGVLSVREADRRKLGIVTRFASGTKTTVALDPGELDAVLLNLVDNAIYWLGHVRTGKRALEIRLRRIERGTRVRVSIHDSGPGVAEENAERVFWPGVTTKPGGIGMGLTIASEIVDAYEGKMALQQPGELDGGSFVFDLPVKQP